MLPELTEAFPQAPGGGPAKALLNPSGPEKGRGNALTSWNPGVPQGVWESSETTGESMPLCVCGVCVVGAYDVGDVVFVCVV